MRAETLAALCMVAGALSGCVDKQAMAVDYASTSFSCPAEKVSAVEVAKDNFRVAGCGKTDVLYCYSYDVNPGQASQRVESRCEPTEAVLQRSAHEDSCSRVCNDAALRCMEGCSGDNACSATCDALSDGCFKGCSGR